MNGYPMHYPGKGILSRLLHWPGAKGGDGGALKFWQFSSMNLPLNHVLIDFVNNSATYMGGAIFVY